MPKVNILIISFICYSFSLLIFLPACSGQEKSKSLKKTPSNNSHISLLKIQSFQLDASSQIGEYFPDILQDRAGNFWFATAFSGLAKFDGDTLTKFTISDGLPHNTLLDLTEDPEGNIWIATRKGVAKYDGKSFINFTEADGLSSNWTSCILADSKGNIWVGTKEGVSIYDGQSFSTFPLPKPKHIDSGKSSNLVNRIIEDRNGNLWFGRKSYGVCKFDGKSFIHFTEADGLYNNNIKSILEDSKGKMWFGALATEKSEGGLTLYDGKSFTTFPEIESLSGHEIWDIWEDEGGKIWFAPKNRGLVLYDEDEFIKVSGSMDLTEYSCVQSILQDQEGKMWFGYSGGIFRLQGSTFVNITKDGPWN